MSLASMVQKTWSRGCTLRPRHSKPGPAEGSMTGWAFQLIVEPVPTLSISWVEKCMAVENHKLAPLKTTAAAEVATIQRTDKWRNDTSVSLTAGAGVGGGGVLATPELPPSGISLPKLIKSPAGDCVMRVAGSDANVEE